MTIAKSLLVKFGQQISYTQRVGGTYDPTTGEYTWDSTVSASIRAVVFPYTDDEIDGTTVLRHDRRVYIAPDAMPAISPRPGDTISTQDGSIVRVERVDRIYRGTTQELYDIQARASNG